MPGGNHAGPRMAATSWRMSVATASAPVLEAGCLAGLVGVADNRLFGDDGGWSARRATVAG
jgi:hypothetical protein